MSFDPIARFYDADHGLITEDIPFYLTFAEEAGGPILDLGAGTARLALAFARAGFAVTGMDSAPAMLAIGRRKVAAAGLSGKIALHQGDFTEFELDQRFALACCGFNGFLHLIEEADQLRALRCWRRHLKPGGVLVLDVENPSLGRLAAADGSLELARHWVDAETGHEVDMLFASQVSFADQVHEVTMFYDEVTGDGVLRRATAHIPTRILFRRELGLLLELAGYSEIGFYGDYDLSAWEPDSPRLLAAATA
jgi:ubiquinone/menaquinone biosynthesis C-methylase UbiE